MGVPVVASIWAAFLALLGMQTPIGTCTAWDYSGSPIVECAYQPNTGPLHDAIMTAVGVEMMAGPWATENDLSHSAIVASVGDAPVMMNITLRGPYGVVFGGEHGLISNVTIDQTLPDAALTVRGGK